jgi:hypothetical protein
LFRHRREGEESPSDRAAGRIERGREIPNAEIVDQSWENGLEAFEGDPDGRRAVGACRRGTG